MKTQSTILLVDDERTVRKVYEVVLTKAGFEVHTADNGVQALEMLQPGHPYDMVISDLNMPKMDGNALVSEMRATPRLAMLPLLMLTASEEQDDCLENLGAGVSDYVVKSRKGSEELLARVANLTRMKRLQDEVERASRTDALTSLSNRRHGCERLEEEIERARRYGRDLAVALIDIDHFKRINDTLGHHAGDDVLVAVSASLAGISRQSDCVIRWGGEEFLFVFPETDGDEAAAIVERFRQHLQDNPIHVSAGDGTDVPVTISGGVSELQIGDTLESLVDRADKGLYEAKEGGRNRLLMWQDDHFVLVTA
ncbi:MAG: diguanylate cyclase [Planctomycetes bacterium]|nr:diguanylate cyclase [Planctomycetota bacterium]